MPEPATAGEPAGPSLPDHCVVGKLARLSRSTSWANAASDRTILPGARVRTLSSRLQEHPHAGLHLAHARRSSRASSLA